MERAQVQSCSLPVSRIALADRDLRPVVLRRADRTDLGIGLEAMELRVDQYESVGVVNRDHRALTQGDVLRLLVDLLALLEIELNVTLLHELVVLGIAPAADVIRLSAAQEDLA